MKLLLASASRYRRELLLKLRIPFDYASPDVDETPIPGELPSTYVTRLAQEKARALHEQYPQHWIIGSDQTCIVNDQICGKPGNAAKAVEQLTQCSGKPVTFLTGLCLRAPDGREWILCEPFTVHFRSLAESDIQRYISLEKPFDCAGSFKVEGLGITLFEKLEGRDSNSLVGLPLIGLVDLMTDAGINPLNEAV